MFGTHLTVDITNRLNKFYAAISSVLKDKLFGFERVYVHVLWSKCLPILFYGLDSMVINIVVLYKQSLKHGTWHLDGFLVCVNLIQLNYYCGLVASCQQNFYFISVCCCFIIVFTRLIYVICIIYRFGIGLKIRLDILFLTMILLMSCSDRKLICYALC